MQSPQQMQSSSVGLVAAWDAMLLCDEIGQWRRSCAHAAQVLSMALSRQATKLQESPGRLPAQRWLLSSWLCNVLH